MTNKSFYCFMVILLLYFCNVVCATTKDIPNLSRMPSLMQPDEFTCGPTSAAMVLKYYGKDVTIETLRKKARVDKFRVTVPGTNMSASVNLGQFDIAYTRPSHLRDALNEYVPFTRKTKASEQDITDAISANKPVIVLVSTMNAEFHYFVIVGYETDNGGKVIKWKIMDTDGAKPRLIARSHFYEAWDFKFTGYLHGSKGDPFGPYKCFVCSEKGNVWTKCPTCSGTGKWSTNTWTYCPACGGKGSWSAFGIKNNCPACSGRGKWSTSAWTKCVACSGHGEWSSKCPTCLGTGNLIESAYWKVVKSGGAEPRTVFIPNIAPPNPTPTPSPSYSLAGTWKSGDNTLAFSADGRFTLYVGGVGQKSYYYSYDRTSGKVVARDARGRVTNITVQWIDQNSFKWTSPNGTRTYQRKT